ncbi:potassium channel family protein [Amnibacterium endophyticum]|uniref:Potassium channel family protein n=1 Tax=Amnibacterium endophyticum TaxID=2109337 RepID=A0ABW4LFQ5_9MICO
MDQDRWRRLSEWPLLGAALVYLAAYSLQVLLPSDRGLEAVLGVVVWVVWAVFLVDYLANLWLAERRLQWFLRHPFDLLTVALPWLRPLRLLVLLRSAMALAKSRAVNLVGGGTLAIAGSGAALVVYVGALAEYSAEHDAPGASIRSFGDALWWAIETVTTVGYGDYTPVTVGGRIIATGVMITGIALIGAVTASLAAWVAQAAVAQQTAARTPRGTEADLHAEIAELRRRLEAAGRE